jgi:hypothetical protein
VTVRLRVRLRGGLSYIFLFGIFGRSSGFFNLGFKFKSDRKIVIIRES